MLINSFKPVRNLVLLRMEYTVKGMILMNDKEQHGVKTLDKIVVAVGPEVKDVHIGDCVAVSENAFNTNAIHFTDNDLARHKVAEKLKVKVEEHKRASILVPSAMQMQHNLQSPINGEYDIAGYMTMPESELIGIVNSIKDEIEEVATQSNNIIIPV